MRRACGTPSNLAQQARDRAAQFALGFADASIKARIVNLGGTVLPGTAAEFGEYVAEETEKWGKVIRAANIKPD
jgi:hypothetical protein